VTLRSWEVVGQGGGGAQIKGSPGFSGRISQLTADSAALLQGFLPLDISLLRDRCDVPDSKASARPPPTGKMPKNLPGSSKACMPVTGLPRQ
jgi:hypothetical protein